MTRVAARGAISHPVMTRRNWDRVRRYRPLDGADPRLDPDGAILWERELGPDREGPLVSRFDPSFVVRRLQTRIAFVH